MGIEIGTDRTYRENLERVIAFTYIISTLAEGGCLDAKITHSVQPGWIACKSDRWLCVIEESN